MKLYQYLFLDEQLQYQTVWEIGKYVDAVEIGVVKYVLYAINDFFVEIEYSTYENRILGKSTFKQGDKLEKYLPAL